MRKIKLSQKDADTDAMINNDFRLKIQMGLVAKSPYLYSKELGLVRKG